MSLKISGTFACFTRPELRAERVSYEVITPSAARGILEAILWKPAIRWQIHSIAVLKPIRWHSIQRNELRGMPSLKDIIHKRSSVCIEEERIQRMSLILKDVAYRIEASFSLTERAGPGDNEQKFMAMFERRVLKGQCFSQPYLGCREFTARFEAIDGREEPISSSKDLGFMLLDVDYTQKEPVPHFFRAHMEEGIIRIPSFIESAS